MKATDSTGLIRLEGEQENNPAFLVTLQIRAKHADLLVAVRKLGTVRALAKYLDVHEGTVGQ